jgi:hypothetical protein
VNLVRSILREKKDPLGMNGKTGVVSSLAGRNLSPLASFEKRTRKGLLGRIDVCRKMAKALPASCRLNSLLFRFRVFLGWDALIFIRH